jgi:divalent metal cation (Fe/Co/Zn/Cd) transporter
VAPRGPGLLACRLGPRGSGHSDHALARARQAAAEAIGSAALRADAVESIACAWLSGVVLVGQLAQLAVGAWWIDGVSALVLVPFLVKEAREAFEGDDD